MTAEHEAAIDAINTALGPAGVIATLTGRGVVAVTAPRNVWLWMIHELTSAEMVAALPPVGVLLDDDAPMFVHNDQSAVYGRIADCIIDIVFNYSTSDLSQIPAVLIRRALLDQYTATRNVAVEVLLAETAVPVFAEIAATVADDTANGALPPRESA